MARLRSAILLPALLCACASAPPAQRPPNVVLIVADDLGWGELGCYGQQRIRTPHIDALAREGTRFTQFYAGAPVCAPSRCTLLTGLHNGHGAVRDNFEVQPEGQMSLPDAEVTLAEVLRGRGYATGCFGKWGLSTPTSEGHPNRQGFDEFFGYICQRQAHNFYPDHLWRNGERVELDGTQYSHDRIAEAALEFVNEHREGPFLLYVPFTIPHLALQVPEDSLAEYRGQWPDPPYEGGKGYRPHPTPRAAYAAMVSRMDRDVGRIVERLRELGLEDDTLVLFTSDNGPTYDRLGGSDSEFFESTGGLRGFKGSVFEGGLRVPLVARWPGHVPAGAVSAQIAAFWDLLPTLAQLCGAQAPERCDGESFAGALLGEGDAPRSTPLYWELASYGGQQALRDGDWKAVRRNLQEGKWRTQLYNLARDPAERRELAIDFPEVVARMDQLFASSRCEHPSFPLSKRN